MIATLLLALSIPCSAQLGAILGLLCQRPTAFLIWGGFMGIMSLSIGIVSFQILPGKYSSFYREIHPLQLPNPKAILIKKYVRLKWYFGEPLPPFVLASVLIFMFSFSLGYVMNL